MKKQHSRKPKPCYKPLSGFRAAASKILRRCASGPAICINGKPAARICRPQKLIASPCIRMQEITGKATNTTGSGAGCAGRQCGMSHRGTERAWTLKIRRWIVITALAVLAVAAMIFIFSAQDAESSSQTSGVLVDRLIHWFHPEFDSLKAKARWIIRQQYQLAVRKAAHFSEFMLLGLFLRLLLKWLRCRHKNIISWVAGTLYAVSDEIHQMFVDGRGPQPLDVGIDSLGVLAGVALMAGIIRLWRKRAPENTT